jgi:hypothetical protein
MVVLLMNGCNTKVFSTIFLQLQCSIKLVSSKQVLKAFSRLCFQCFYIHHGFGCALLKVGVLPGFRVAAAPTTAPGNLQINQNI